MIARIMTEQRRLTANNEEIDLNTCDLDVYEIVIFNAGTASIELVPLGMIGNPNRPISNALTGIVLQRNQTLRLYAGDKYPRGDQYTLNVITPGTIAVNLFLYGVPKANRL
jgi:hypothetical protein